MSDLDQRIDQALIDALPQWFFDSDETGVVLTATLESATPAIIAVIREALLSPEVVKAARRKMLGPSPRNTAFGVLTPERSLTAAIAAAFGEEASDE